MADATDAQDLRKKAHRASGTKLPRMDRPGSFRGIFRADAPARAVYSESAGIQRVLPIAIAVPVDVEDLAVLLECAKREGAALIPRGSGSSMSGAAIGPGVIVDLSRWKNVDDSRIEDRSLSVQPGVICAEVHRIAHAKGLRFPVSPSSAAFCTIGGMTATNAAGAHTLRYGAMREWVNAIDWIGADGRPQRSERAELDKKRIPRFPPESKPRKSSSGYFLGGDEVDVLVGSEGTLGFFTGIELRLTDEPKSAASVMGVFSSLEAATEAAIRARESGAAACELLDRTFLEFAGVESAEAILLADAEGTDEGEARTVADQIVRGFIAAGATDARIAATHEERERLWELRHAASPILNRLSEQLKSMQVIEDGCVPPARLGEYVTGLRAAFDRQRIRGVIFGHAGDAHVHANALVNVMEADWRGRVERLLDEVTTLVASLHGTISGEHGDGRLRTPLLGRMFSPVELAEFERIKARYDADGLMNPGVKTRARPGIGDIKYDPALPARDEAVTRALQHVERDRAYAAFRLDLV
jgi:FAD/FMN-containing dehydrogenase